MSIRTKILGLAVSLSMLPVLANAEEPCHTPAVPQYTTGSQYQQYPQAPVYPARRPGGRYERGASQQWAEGRYQQVWVPQQCYTTRWNHGRHGSREVCRPGYYDQRWVPGHYETVNQWVWVPYRGEHRLHIMMNA